MSIGRFHLVEYLGFYDCIGRFQGGIRTTKNLPFLNCGVKKINSINAPTLYAKIPAAPVLLPLLGLGR